MFCLVVLFSLIGGVFSLIGGVFLLTRKSWSQEDLMILVSFAAGVLLTVSFTDLLPEALEISKGFNLSVDTLLIWVLGAMIVLFIFERSFVWIHCHHDRCEDRHESMIPLIWLGDTIHNFIDGIVIAASFMVNISLGITTSLAVAAHEVPQEVADFSLFLSKGMSRKKALLLNITSAFATTFAAVLAYTFWNLFSSWQPHLLSITAGMFIYIACSDLIPELHHELTRKRIWLQVTAFMLGVLSTYSLGKLI